MHWDTPCPPQTNFKRPSNLYQSVFGINCKRSGNKLGVSKRENGFGEGKKWPDYRISLAGAPLKEDGTPDRSAADFRWCLYAVKRMGWTDENEIARKLMEVSQRAKDGGWNYALHTARKSWL